MVTFLEAVPIFFYLATTSSNTRSRTLKTTDQFLLRSTAALHDYFGIEDGPVPRNDFFNLEMIHLLVFSNLAEKGRMWVCLNGSKNLWVPCKRC